MICVLVGGDMYDVYDCSRCDVLCLSQLIKVWFARNVSSANDLHHIIEIQLRPRVIDRKM